MIPGDCLKRLINRKQFKFTVCSWHGNDPLKQNNNQTSWLFFPKLMGRTMARNTLMHVASCCIMFHCGGNNLYSSTVLSQQWVPFACIDMSLQILVCTVWSNVYIQHPSMLERWNLPDKHISKNPSRWNYDDMTSWVLNSSNSFCMIFLEKFESRITLAAG